jgi:AcrR family transcriptional regulator
VIQNRKRREKDLRRQAILEAAKKVFFLKGYTKATMDEIALAAEISKPTVYHYFKSKDDLFFSLMLPVVEQIGMQLEKVRDNILENNYATGALLIRDMFQALWKSYSMAPDIFRIIQIFQQSGMVREWNPQIRSSLNNKGRHNFKLARQITEIGIRKDLIKETNPYEYVDVLWGLFVGIVQLEDIKSREPQGSRYLQKTLDLAEKILIDAMAQEKIKPG